MALPTIIYLQHIPKGTITRNDLTGDFFSAPVFTDVGSGEVNTAIIVISALNGKYISSAPVIDGYDRIYVSFIDDAGNPYTKTFKVILTVPVETKSSGTKLELHLVGVEADTQKINYIKPWYGADPKSVVTDIATYYNKNSGTNQTKINLPLTQVSLPTWTVSNYDFGLNQETCYNRIIQVNDKMGGAVAEGGVVDFFDCLFDTSQVPNINPTMTMIIQSSGSSSVTGTPVVISNTKSVNVGQTEGGIQAKRGTMIAAWGESSSGSLPTDYSKYTSQEVMFGLHQYWSSGITYPQNSFVQLNGIHYQCNNANGTTSTPPSGDWTVVTLGSLWANSNSYSPWTRNMYNWKNSGSCPSNYNPNAYALVAPGFYDSNIIVQDDQNGSFRSWAQYQVTSDFSDIITQFLYAGVNGYYRGLRVLCGVVFPGTDRNGIAYANNIAEYDGSEWVCKYQSQLGMTCAVLFEGLVYYFTGSLWSVTGDYSSVGKNPADCLHTYQQVNQIPGITATATNYYSTNVSNSTVFLSNHLYAVKLNLTPNQSLDGVTLNCASFWSAVAPFYLPNIRVKAYTDSGGSPNTIIPNSDGGQDFMNQGFFKYYFKSPVIVPSNGIIWIAFEVNNCSGVYMWCQTGQASGTLKSVSHTVGLGPSTFGAATNGTTPFSVGVIQDTLYNANINSAIRVEYRWNATSQLSPTLPAYYSIGAWLNLSIPFPESTLNSGGSADPVGSLYGGALTGRDAVCEPATLDVENMHLTHDGYRGFNRLSAIDYGNIFSLDFFLRLTYQADFPSGLGFPSDWGWTSPTNIAVGNFNMRCILADQSDNMVMQDFVLPFNGNWSAVKLPISGFTDYRAIKPLASLGDYIIPPKELDINNVFEWTNIKRIIIQTQDSYDTQGRYNPTIVNSRWSQADISLVGNITLTNRRILLDIDGVRFSKVLLAIAPTSLITDEVIQPDFLEKPEIILFDNLQNEANTQLAIDQNRHVEYDFDMTGSFAITFSDTNYLYNPRIVSNRNADGTPVPNSFTSGHGDLLYPNSQMPAGAPHRIWAVGSGGDGLDYYHNTVKLVAKRIEHSITKPSDAPGGFITKIVDIKRWI